LIGRIHHRHEFDELARGRRVQTTTLWCRHLDDPTVVPVRVAFAIGRNVANAVRRNRLRRRLRAILLGLAVPGGLLVDGRLVQGRLLIGARSAALERTFVELRQEVGELLQALAAGRPVLPAGGAR